MIPRYEVKEISQIWTDEEKFKAYLDAELAIMTALEARNLVPKGTAEKIRSKAVINPARIDEIEKVTRHDVIAFCTSITEQLDNETGRYFHFGVTSSDIIDTALTIQIKKSLEIVRQDLVKVLNALKDRSIELKDLITIGRSHGMTAEPLSMGQKFLGFYAEFYRGLEDLDNCIEKQLRSQFSGAVGNYTILSPKDEEVASKALGLKVESLSTQVIPRDRLARIISVGGIIASAIERIATEIRHLHRSEVNELHEGFAKGQKGSSTMPHKKNPIAGENLTGMARVLRSHTIIALENVVLWHERDISHSSTERMYLPDHFGLLSYSLRRLASTITNLNFHNEIIENRVKEQSSYLSSYYLHHLIEKTELSREDLYALVQSAAFKGQELQNAEAFHQTLEVLLKEKGYSLNLPKPNFAEIKNIYLKAVDDIFSRVLTEYPL
jgi:adenylosuccinate lyase